MAYQSITLDAAWWGQLTGSQRGWEPGANAPAIISGLAEGGATDRTLFAFGVYSGGLVRASINNGDLSDEVELNGGYRLTVGSQSWVFLMAGADLIEPYFWFPDNDDEAAEIYNLIDSATAATLEISDDPDTDFSDGAVLPQALSMSAGAGNPTASFDLRAVAPAQQLVLADSDDTGLEVIAKALLEASAPGTTGNNFYADSDRGGSDTPLDGELGLGDDETVISRFRRADQATLAINDDDNPVALDIGAYFNAGGDGNDLTIYLQTAGDGEVSFTAAVQFVSGGIAFVRFTLPADAQTLLDNLASGDRFIFKAARPTSVTPEQLAVLARAGDPVAGFDLRAVAPSASTRQLSVSARAGDPTVTWNLQGVLRPWPATLPQELLRENFRQMPVDNVISTQVDRGIGPRRPRHTRAIQLIRCAMFMTPAQWVTLEEFYLDDLNGGSLPFDFPHPFKAEVLSLEFVRPPSRARSRANYIVSLQLKTT